MQKGRLRLGLVENSWGKTGTGAMKVFLYCSVLITWSNLYRMRLNKVVFRHPSPCKDFITIN